MIKKLFSLFAIATLASFSTYANEEVTNAPVILEEVSEVEKTELLAADEILLEEGVNADEEKTELADCGCGCKPKKNGKNEDCNENDLLANCGCKKKKKGENETTTEPVEAPKELLADNTAEETTEEILPTEETLEKFASCCPSETKDAAPIVEEVIEEAKLA